MQIKGIATITEKGFHFDSGMPSGEPVLDEARRFHGTLRISENACVEFVDNGRVYLPPEVHRVASGDCFKVRRTTRHYIIQLKLPLAENRRVSEERIIGVLPIVLGEITLDRRELFEDVIE